MDHRRIVAIGGRVLVPDDRELLIERYLLEQSRARVPRVCFIGTATGDDPALIARFYRAYARLDCRADHLELFRRTPADLRAFILGFDVVHVGGGNTRSMLAVWRHWGLDTILREAWNEGVLLAGGSAGMICWFEAALTDSVAGSLTATDGLGFLPGSACPHYDGERDRRPTYHRLVAEGALPSGYACDDGAALHFRGTEPFEAVASRPGSRAYRIERGMDGVEERALPTREL